MQQHRGQMEEDLGSTEERLARTEGERDGLRNELKKMKKEADEANARLTRSMSNGKVADVFSELNSLVESLSKSNEELTIKELAIKSLKDELIQARDIEGKLAEKDAHLQKLEAELAQCRQKIQQLQAEMEKTKGSEPETSTPENPLLKEIESLKNELKLAMKAEENNKKAMDDLAFALKEVATEASQTKEKLAATEEKLQHFKKESEDLKEALKTLGEKHKSLLDETKKEADLQRNIADRLRLEAEETLEAWNGKETGLVDCIKRAEDEKIAALEENTKLLEALTNAENMNKTAKQENQKLRDILKQALNEANVAKEAAGIAQSENSQLQDLLAEKDDALIFITRENENLRINEVAAMEQIKELKKLLSESPGFKAEEEEHEKHNKTLGSTEKVEKQRKLSNAFSLNLKDLITYPKHKDTHDQDHKIHEKPNESEEEDEENADLFKGSIFDVTTDSPLAAAAAEKNNHHHHHHQHHHTRKPSFADEGETVLNPDELEQIVDEADIERNSKKKRALLRRFGDIIIRRKGSSGMHRRELSNGGEIQKKETIAAGSEGHKKEPASAPAASSDQSHNKDVFSDPAV